jgi:hypothetical protein
MNKTEQLKEAIATLADLDGNPWVRVGEVQELTGMTAAELAGAVTEALKDDGFRAEPEPHRHRLTEADRAYAPTVGGEPRHLLSWKR